MYSLKSISFFVVQVMMLVLAVSPSLQQATDLPKSKWHELTKRAEIRLEQLAIEQGPRFKLIRIDNVQEQRDAGQKKISIKGQFQTATGEQIKCVYDLWKAELDGYEEYSLRCGEKEYKWSQSCGK